MKAIRVKEFGGPEVLRVEEMPAPQPGSDQVLVRIHAIGVNPVETYIRAGTYARLPALPYTPGNDGAGVVEQAGPDFAKFEKSDRVYTAGYFSAPTPNPVKRCWFTVRAAVSAQRRCNWRALAVCVSSARRAVTKDAS